MSTGRDSRGYVAMRHMRSCGPDGAGPAGPPRVGACAEVSCRSGCWDEFTTRIFSMARNAARG